MHSTPTIHEIQGLVYGGFWIRFCAKVLDWTICSILVAVIPLPILNNSDVIVVSNHLPLNSSFLIKWLIPALYTTFFLVNYQATPGKMAFSLRVIPANHKEITYGIALARFFCEMVSAFFLFIGYILAIFDIQKRTLHDRICKTYVVQATQVIYRHNNHVDSREEEKKFYSELDIKYNHTYGLHTMLFSMMILESLFSIAYFFMEDPLFRMVTWSLNFLIGIFLMIAIIKQKYPNFSSSIRRLTWGVCLYYCVITPIIYMLFFLIGIERFLRDIPLDMNDPIMFMFQLVISISEYMVFFSWPKLLVSVIFIPCSLILGIWGIILISSLKIENR